MNPIVKFSNVDDFLDELEERPPNVDRILRIAYESRATETLPLCHYSVVASYLWRSPTNTVLVVDLHHYCGQAFTGGPRGTSDALSAGVFERAERVRMRVEELAAKLRLTLAGGQVEAAPIARAS